MMNDYQEKLDGINNKNLYTCRQLKDMLLNSTFSDEKATFQAVCRKYISELEEEGRRNYSILLERNCRYPLAELNQCVFNSSNRFVVNMVDVL